MTSFQGHDCLGEPSTFDIARQLNSSTVGVFACTASGRLTYTNDSFADSIGLQVGEWVWRSLTSNSRQTLRDLIRVSTTETQSGTCVVTLKGAPARTGRSFWVVATIEPSKDGPEVRGVIVDLDESRTENQTNDPLTGLMMRECAIKELNKRLADTSAKPLAVMFLDLNDFKEVNDTYGHEAGDGILRAVAQRLENCVRDDDVVARLGGDEFLVIADAGPYGRTALALARRFKAVVTRPVRTGQLELSPQVSIGVAFDTAVGLTAEQLIGEADQAMYEAKATKHLSQSDIAVASQTSRERFSRRLCIERDFEPAWRAGDIRFVYQPVRRLEDLEILGAEAFLRWDHEELGPIRPREILSVANNAAHVKGFTEWTLATVTAEWASLRARWPYFFDKSVSINIDPNQLLLAGYLDLHTDALANNHLQRSDIILEVQDWEFQKGVGVTEALGVLADAGVPVALDYFGVGYNALEYLQTVPVRGLKIAPALIRAAALAGTSEGDAARSIIRGLLVAMSGLEIAALAEGLENERQLAVCRELGILVGQGYALGLPVPLDEFEANERRLYANRSARSFR